MPRSKAKGLYPWNCWGAVGYNKKTRLHFLEKGQNLTAEIYRELVESHLVNMRGQCTDQDEAAAREYAGGRLPRIVKPMLIIQDNDSKHYNEINIGLFKTWNLHTVVSERLDEEGSTDIQPGRGGHWVEQRPSFPAYSPDVNSPIEKVWREVQRRVLNADNLARLRTREDFKRAIIHVWNSIEFEPAYVMGQNWCGINALVDQIPTKVLPEVIAEDGYDTHYMR